MAPSVEVAKKLAETFGVTLDYLVDGTGGADKREDYAATSVIDMETLEQEDKRTDRRTCHRHSAEGCRDQENLRGAGLTAHLFS